MATTRPEPERTGEPATVRSPERGVFTNRTLNLRSIRAVGFDMDYTVIHYRAEEWESRAYEHIRRRFEELGWPVGDLRFDADRVIRGLTLDLELGNVLKANRFGWVIQGAHGTRPLDYDTLRRTYAGMLVDLWSERFRFMYTFFSLSEVSIFTQLVDLLDEGRLPGVLGYADLHHKVRTTLDTAHMEGELKDEILADPERFIVLDSELPLALLDLHHSGKRLLLITNSEWSYTKVVMEYAFRRYLPDGMTWRDLFDIVIVSARKPGFFSERNPLYEVVDEEKGLLVPSLTLEPGKVYSGGDASLVEKHLDLSGDEILYVGDHLFGDVHISKSALRWRTALILRELEEELAALRRFRPQEEQLVHMMREKESIEAALCRLRLDLQRARRDYGPAPATPREAAEREIADLRAKLASLDERIGPFARAAREIRNPTWGLLMRAGNDKSLYARQVERHADIYTSRVSNFLYETPFAFLRAPRGNLPHDTD